MNPRRSVCMPKSVADDGVTGLDAQGLVACQEGQLDRERSAGHGGAGLPRPVHRRLGSAPRRDEIVFHPRAVVRRQGVYGTFC